jgi:hypothetical protein
MYEEDNNRKIAALSDQVSLLKEVRVALGGSPVASPR